MLPPIRRQERAADSVKWRLDPADFSASIVTSMDKKPGGAGHASGRPANKRMEFGRVSILKRPASRKMALFPSSFQEKKRVDGHFVEDEFMSRVVA